MITHERVIIALWGKTIPGVIDAVNRFLTAWIGRGTCIAPTKAKGLIRRCKSYWPFIPPIQIACLWPQLHSVASCWLGRSDGSQMDFTFWNTKTAGHKDK
jgi:hypothetical protein